MDTKEYEIFCATPVDEARYRAWINPNLRKRKLHDFVVKTADGAEIHTTAEHLLVHSVFFEQYFNGSFSEKSEEGGLEPGYPPQLTPRPCWRHWRCPRP